MGGHTDREGHRCGQRPPNSTLYSHPSHSQDSRPSSWCAQPLKTSQTGGWGEGHHVPSLSPGLDKVLALSPAILWDCFPQGEGGQAQGSSGVGCSWGQLF